MNYSWKGSSCQVLHWYLLEYRRMFGINFGFPLAGGTKVCVYTFHLYKIQTHLHDEKVQRTSPLPAYLTALVPNEALQGVTHCTLQDWVLPLSWESICYGSEKPQVVVHLERTGRLHARAHKFNGSSLKAESHLLQLPTFMSRVSMEQWNRLLIRLIYIKV